MNNIQAAAYSGKCLVVQEFDTEKNIVINIFD